MSEAECLEALGQFELSEVELDRLEAMLCLRAAVLGWTGDPLKQPASSVLACVRQLKREGGLAV